MRQATAVFGGSFNPPGIHHRKIAEALAAEFQHVIVVPCGPRPDKPTTNDVEAVHRAGMVDLAFRDLDRVRVELFDLEASTFSPIMKLEERFSDEGPLWHAVDATMIAGGAAGEDAIRQTWQNGHDAWDRLHWAVIASTDDTVHEQDLPPQSCVLRISPPVRNEVIRESIYHRRPVDAVLPPNVADYVNRYGLYRGTPAIGTTSMSFGQIRALLVVDDHSTHALQIAETLQEIAVGAADQPDLIIVVGGDGTMLRAIREHWRLRVPFFGINVGHIGFLLNNDYEQPLRDRQLIVQHLPLLFVETESVSGELHRGLAFNDAWVERTTGQTAWIRVSVDDRERIGHLVADGALVATPAGSTGYARAMGGTPLPLSTPALSLVGSNVLRPAGWKRAVLPWDSTLSFTTLDPDKRPLAGYLDGVSCGEVVRMSIRRSRIAAVELAFNPAHPPSEKLAGIQFPRT